MEREARAKPLFPVLKPGDIFCVTDRKSLVSKAINAWQFLHAADRESTYSHAGVITSRNGDTFEALYDGIRRANLFGQYAGKPIIIGRHIHMTAERFMDGMERIAHLENKTYPYWRLLLHTVPILSRFVHPSNRPVCSELQWMFLGIEPWWGVTPDMAADRIRQWRMFDVLYEGPCESRPARTAADIMRPVRAA